MNRRMLTVLLAGVLFGVGLAVSGMTDPSRVTGFLDVAGRWDPTLVFVMAGAVTSYGTAMKIRRLAAQGRGWFGSNLPERKTEAVDRRLVIGALVFGVGWGLAGLCPGPAVANLGALRMQSLVFVPAMVAGMWMARRFFGADQT